MAGVDTSIYGLANPGTAQRLPGPLELAQSQLTLQSLATQNAERQQQLDMQTRQNQAQQQMADIYRGALNPDGTPNHQVVIQAMADRGLGYMIPQYRKQMLDTAKDQAEIDSKNAGTRQTDFDTTKKRYDATQGVLAALLQQPGVGYGDVTRAVQGLVDNQILTPDMGRATLDGMIRETKGNEAGLRGWLVQSGLRVMDASKRLEALAPQVTTRDNGQQIVTGSTPSAAGLLSGEAPTFTPGGPGVQKQATPDTVYSGGITTRGQDMTDRRERAIANQSNARESVQVVDSPSGMVRVNKATGEVMPLTNPNGTPLVSPSSVVFKNGQMYDKLKATIGEARSILPGATGSTAGHVADLAAGAVGYGTQGAEATARLKAIGGWMMANVPRMEGPQSDHDVKMYQEMAGDVADDTKPVSIRLKALDQVENLIEKYKSLNLGVGRPQTPILPGQPANPGGPGPRVPLDAFYRP